MKLGDYVDLSLSNLWKRKLRTSLTIFGVVIGIGALVSMVAFGKGMQRNVTEAFESLELFNYITVFSRASSPGRMLLPLEMLPEDAPDFPLNDVALEKFRQLAGVETVLPDIRFPAEISLNGRSQFSLVQVLPVRFTKTTLVKLRAGQPYQSDDEDQLVISDSLLRRLGIKDVSRVVGQTVTIATLVLDLGGLSPADIPAILSGSRLPFSRKEYDFKVAGVSERIGMGGSALLRSDVCVPAVTADRMQKIPISSLWDFFGKADPESTYSIINVKVTAPDQIDRVQAAIQGMGFNTFALVDQFEEIKTGFVYMDMFLLAVGMIAIVVASLGIVNTMIMSVMERTGEIGIMKAVGASDQDVKQIFFFESSVIGLFGGIIGLGLGWAVSGVINRVVNYFLSQRGVPDIDYFSFPWWMCAAAVAFAVVVSLLSGIYPAVRAARVDPVVALRHD